MRERQGCHKAQATPSKEISEAFPGNFEAFFSGLLKRGGGFGRL